MTSLRSKVAGIFVFYPRLKQFSLFGRAEIGARAKIPKKYIYSLERAEKTTETLATQAIM